MIAILAALATAGPSSAGTVRIVEQSARWTGLMPIDDLQETGQTMFVISGELENTGTEPIHWVKLSYELLDGGDDHPVVVASEYGYNLRAEALRGDDGASAATAASLRPLAAGEKDLFRMVFFRSDVPRFAGWRVRILEVR